MSKQSVLQWRVPTLHTDNQTLIAQHGAAVHRWRPRWTRSQSRDRFFTIVDARLLFGLHGHKSFSGVVYNGSLTVRHGEWWVDAPRNMRNSQCERFVSGPAVTFHSWRMSSFGHVVCDLLPMAFSVLGNSTNTQLILLHTTAVKAVFQTLAPALTNRFYLTDWNLWTCVSGNLKVLLSGAANPFDWHRALHLRRARAKLDAFFPFAHPRRNAVVYCTRRSPTAKHGRRIPYSHSRDILTEVRNAMRSHQRQEDFKLHTGRKRFAVQMRLFYSATFVIGPHGSGITNILWMNIGNRHPLPGVLEFICTSLSVRVQDNGACPWGNTQYWFLSGAQWVDYHHIGFAQNSSAHHSYINLTELRMGLDAMFFTK